MIERENLEQLHHLNKEIDLLRTQIDCIENKVVKDSVKGSSIDFPYTQHTMVISGLNVGNKRVARIKRKLSRKLNELIDIVEKTNDYINNIPDSEMRQILTLRYVNNLTWQQVAVHMGTQGDGSTERKKCDRFLDSFPQFPKKE